MARNETFGLTVGVWTQLTNAAATAARVQNRSGYSILISATNGATAPTTVEGAIELLPYQIMAADITLAELWPGVTGANRLWGYSDNGATVSVSHADA